MEDPQSWNGYAYVRNSPLTLVDPDGEDYQTCGSGSCGNHSDVDFGNYVMSLWQANYKLQGDVLSGRILTPDGSFYQNYKYFLNGDAARFDAVKRGVQQVGPGIRGLGAAFLAFSAIATGGVTVAELAAGGGLTTLGNLALTQTGYARLGYVFVSGKGLSMIRQHLSSIDSLNETLNVMSMERLGRALNGSRLLANGDKNYYLHELQEMTLMSKSGLSQPAAHEAALVKQGMSRFGVYSREVTAAAREWLSDGYRRYWGLK